MVCGHLLLEIPDSLYDRDMLLNTEFAAKEKRRHAAPQHLDPTHVTLARPCSCRIESGCPGSLRSRAPRRRSLSGGKAAERRRPDARRGHALRRRLSPQVRRQLSRDPHAPALQQGRGPDLRLRAARVLRLALLHRRDPGRARPVHLGRRVLRLPRRGPGRLRHHRVGRQAARRERQGRHVRLLVCGRDAVDAGDVEAAVPGHDRAGDDFVRLLRRLELRRRRVVAGVRGILAAGHHRPHRLAASRRPGGDRPHERGDPGSLGHLQVPADQGVSRGCGRTGPRSRPTSTTGSSTTPGTTTGSSGRSAPATTRCKCRP